MAVRLRSLRFATSTQDYEQKNVNGFKRYRTRNRITDHVLLDREQPNNAGDQGRLVNVSLLERRRPAVSRKQQPILMETCTVCGGSFKMGRGLSLHKTKSRCGALEASRKLYKSRKGGPQDQHHSGTTKESFPKSSASPQGTPRIEENKKENQQFAVESKDQGVKHHGNALSKSNTTVWSKTNG